MSWQLISESHPTDESYCEGDRLALIVHEREEAGCPLVARIVMLSALEDGWKSDDPRYSGYTPQDGIAWAWEKDLVKGFTPTAHNT